jgi:hypothetical protein
MKNQMIWGLIAIFIASIVALAGISYAYKGNPATKGPNYSTEVHEQLEAAIEAGDYDAWLKIRQDNNLPTKGRIFQVINKDNFDKYAQLHEANMAGDTQKAAEIRAELGLGEGMIKNGSGKMGQGKGNMQNYAGQNNEGNSGTCKRTGN